MFKVLRQSRLYLNDFMKQKFNLHMHPVRKMNHLERTAANMRDKTSKAVVVSMEDISESVKKLTLKIESKEMYFKPGQWVDFFIPGVATVGGFSMCSNPKSLIEKGTLELAIKRSDHPPSNWVHTECKKNSMVTVTVGGDFFLDKELIDKKLLFIAGGVGINPLYSMIQHVTENKKNSSNSAVLLYSAKNENELIFKKEIDILCDNNDFLKAEYFITKEQSDNNYSYGRIKIENIKDYIDKELDNKPSDLFCYICGPPPFIDCMETYLHKLGVPEENVNYEKWW